MAQRDDEAARDWAERWHRGEIDSGRRDDQSAAEWQAELFDSLVAQDPVEAFGVGAVQEALWAKRIRLALEFANGRAALDVGCGNGRVPRALAEGRGVPVTGIDVSAACVRYAAERNAHPLVTYAQSSIEAFEPPTPFGLITMYEVLEHVDDPVAVLTRLRSWLTPGGHLIFSTPNRSGLNRKLKNAPGLKQLYTRVAALPPDAAHPGHVEEYHYEELLDMVRRAGLEVERVGGAVLLMPFPAAIGALARSPRFARLNVRSGDWSPRLAGDVYLVARRPR